MSTVDDRREQDRYPVSCGIRAVAAGERDYTLCSLIDISEGGLSICYENDQPLSIKSISILPHDEFWGVTDIPVHPVWDYDFPFSSSSIRLVGVRFRSLPYQKISQLNFFLNNCKINIEANA